MGFDETLRKLFHGPFRNRRPSAPARRLLAAGALAGLTVAVGAFLTEVQAGPPAPAELDGSSRGSDFRLPASVKDGVAASAASSSPVAVQLRLDRKAVPAGGDGRLYAELVVQGEERPDELRLPTDLILVLDHSGSMSGIKLEQARNAAADLVDRLAPEDRFALVTFASKARLRIPPTAAEERRREHWRHQIQQLEVGGSTNMVSALEIAADLLRERAGSDRPCRVLLLSDGRPDTEAGLPELARFMSRRGTALSTLGIGADFNEVLMGNLADLGTGNYYYLDHPETLASVFAGELDAGRGTVARGLEIHLTPASGVKLEDAAGYPVEHTADGYVLRPGDLFAGQTRRLWLTLEVETAEPFDPRSLGDLTVRYTTDGESSQVRPEQPFTVACVKDRNRFLAGVDGDAWGRAVTHEEYGRLKNRVAALVRDGKKEQARKAIDDYVTETSRQNAELKNPAVSANLAEVENMRSQVDDAFRGADQELKRKRVSKEQHEISQQLRRLGSLPANKGGS